MKTLSNIVFIVVLSLGLISCGSDSGNNNHNEGYPNLDSVAKLGSAILSSEVVSIKLNNKSGSTNYSVKPKLLTSNGKVGWITCKDNIKYLYIKSESTRLITEDGTIKTQCASAAVGYESLGTDANKSFDCLNNGNIVYTKDSQGESVNSLTLTYYCYKSIFIKESVIKSIISSKTYTPTGDNSFKNNIEWLK